MHRKRLVVVDGDVRNLRVLERKLGDAGFEVHVARRTDEALELAFTHRPDVVLSELSGPNIDGLELCRVVKSDERTTGCGIIFLSRDVTVEAKRRALDAGCDEYLHKPIFVREIVLRLGNLIGRLEKRDSPSSFSGSLSRLSTVDLLQLMEASRKTCIVNLRSDFERSGGFAPEDQQGAIFFSAGQVVAAYVGKLVGRSAIYRMLLWKDGAFEIEFTPIDQANSINESTQALLLEGMRRMDEWTRALEVVRSPGVRLWLTPDAVADLGSAPEHVLSVLPLFDGRRSLLEVLDALELEDETPALAAISRLVQARKLVAADEVTTDDLGNPIPLTQVKHRNGQPGPEPPRGVDPSAPPEPIRERTEDSTTEKWWRDMMKLV
jgi:CheY-like chemotaxis protein